MRGMNSLNLWMKDIGSAGAASIAQMTGLTDLNLDENRIGEAGQLTSLK